MGCNGWSGGIDWSVAAADVIGRLRTIIRSNHTMGQRIFQMKPGHECDEDKLCGIDRQHLRIYALVKEFNIALRDGGERERLLLILEEIIERSQGHFAAEERVLREVEHPSYRVQKTTHRLIIDELMLFHRFMVSSQVVSREQCVHAMDSLLVHHIKDEPAFFARRGGQVADMRVAAC
jgi:hemerythrin